MKEALRKTKKVVKRKTDKRQRGFIEYKEGDGSNISSDRPTKKLAFKRASPFLVIKKIRSSTYEL